MISLLIPILVVSPDALADVPPPPVNQDVGIGDYDYSGLTTEDCTECHGSDIADAHHAMALASGIRCRTCHSIHSTTGLIPVCTSCHSTDSTARPRPPHHTTTEATSFQCSQCHGSVVQDPGDTGFIPDYDITSFTPDDSCKSWSTDPCVAGDCDGCHQADSSASPAILSISTLHHGINFSSCSVCHTIHPITGGCQRCHTADADHNIQADSDEASNLGTIVPGAESYGYGHIGHSWDCYGCHDTIPTAAPSEGGPSALALDTLPQIEALDMETVFSGESTAITVGGQGLVTLRGETDVPGEVVLSDGYASWSLDVLHAYDDEIVAVVPEGLEVGVYEVRVVKGDRKSNPRTLAVLPEVAITDIQQGDRGIVIEGTGFGEQPSWLRRASVVDAVDDPDLGLFTAIGVTLLHGGSRYDCQVYSWTDTRVVAACPYSEGTVRLSGVFGTARASLGVTLSPNHRVVR